MDIANLIIALMNAIMATPQTLVAIRELRKQVTQSGTAVRKLRREFMGRLRKNTDSPNRKRFIRLDQDFKMQIKVGGIAACITVATGCTVQGGQSSYIDVRMDSGIVDMRGQPGKPVPIPHQAIGTEGQAEIRTVPQPAVEIEGQLGEMRTPGSVFEFGDISVLLPLP